MDIAATARVRASSARVFPGAGKASSDAERKSAAPSESGSRGGTCIRSGLGFFFFLLGSWARSGGVGGGEDNGEGVDGGLTGRSDLLPSVRSMMSESKSAASRS